MTPLLSIDLATWSSSAAVAATGGTVGAAGGWGVVALRGKSQRQDRQAADDHAAVQPEARRVPPAPAPGHGDLAGFGVGDVVQPGRGVAGMGSLLGAEDLAADPLEGGRGSVVAHV